MGKYNYKILEIKDLPNEIWKDIPEYEGYYQASNLGRVKSLWYSKGKILKYCLHQGYEIYHISKNGKVKNISAHRLVVFAFLNHDEKNKSLFVNHKNFIRNDNRLQNLELITPRENSNQIHLRSSSKFVGVRYMKQTKIWYAYITYKRKKIHLGSFKNEIDAHHAYQNKLKLINNEIPI
jgi:hypothetical protein